MTKKDTTLMRMFVEYDAKTVTWAQVLAECKKTLPARQAYTPSKTVTEIYDRADNDTGLTDGWDDVSVANTRGLISHKEMTEIERALTKR